MRAHPDRFEVVGLAAGGLTPGPARTRSAAAHPRRRRSRSAPTGRRPSWSRSVDADIVLNGITGSIGLEPTLAALRAGRMLALANKESLVAGGSLVTDAAAPGQIVPVDSEHSALAQCLRGGTAGEVARLVRDRVRRPVPRPDRRADGRR